MEENTLWPHRWKSKIGALHSLCNSFSSPRWEWICPEPFIFWRWCHRTWVLKLHRLWLKSCHCQPRSMYLISLSFTFIVGKMGTQTPTCLFVRRIQWGYMWRTEHFLTNNLCLVHAHSLWLLGKGKCKVTDQSREAVHYHWLGQSLLVYR